jgi:hypothetical protein
MGPVRYESNRRGFPLIFETEQWIVIRTGAKHKAFDKMSETGGFSCADELEMALMWGGTGQ